MPTDREQTELNKSLFKAVVRNDVEYIRNLIDLEADVNSEFTINELINNELLDDNAIIIVRDAKTTVDTLLRRERHIDDNTVSIITQNSYREVIFLPIVINKIILSPETKLSTLQLAMMYGWKEAIVELIKRGVNPNKALDIQGITILQLMGTAAVFRDNRCYLFDEEIIQLLLDHGADPNIKDITGKTFLHYALLVGDFLVDERMRSLKMQSENALDRECMKRAEKLLINGANPNIKDSYNHCTLLYYIVDHDSYLNIQPSLINLLLDHGCTYATYEDVLKNPSIIAMMQEDYGRDYGIDNAKAQVEDFKSKHQQHVEKNSQLIEAIKSRNKSKVNTLLNEDINSNIRDKDGLSALHLAVKLGEYAIANLLLDKNANPNIKGWKNGTTPLFNAVISNRTDIAELLLKHAANPSVINTKGLSPLYFSLINNNVEMTKLLLSYKANPDVSHQIPLLLNVLNVLKNDSDIEVIENTLEKIKNVVNFLKSKDICVDCNLLYQSLSIAEKSGKENTANKVQELIDELSSPDLHFLLI